MNGLTSQDMLNKIIWIRGIPPIDFWIRREGMIGNFIRKNKLKPIDTSAFNIEGQFASVAATKQEMAEPVLRRPPFPGGMRVPHLHFLGDVFVLSAEQWKSFSGEVVSDLNKKLSAATILSFDQIRDIAEGLDKIG